MREGGGAGGGVKVSEVGPGEELTRLRLDMKCRVQVRLVAGDWLVDDSEVVIPWLSNLQ